MSSRSNATEAAPSREDLAALEASAAAAARLLKMLASEQRLMLLCRLGEGETSVGELARHAGLSQTTASQHLAKLRAEGVVATRRDAQTIYYRLADPAALQLIGMLCTIYRPAQDPPRQSGPEIRA